MKLRKVLSLLVAFVMMFEVLPMASVASESEEATVLDSGTTGGYDNKNLTWVLTSDGTLSISGTGPMDQIDAYSIGTPWSAYSKFIKNVVIGDGVTDIGPQAFMSCSNLVSVSIPDSVTWIDVNSFAFCTGLVDITIPDSVTGIGTNAISGCTGLVGLTIPDSVTFIGAYAFYHCTSLTNVTISNSVTSIKEGAFYDCTALSDVYYIGTEEEWNEIEIDSYNECLLNANIHYIVVEYAITVDTTLKNGTVAFNSSTLSAGDTVALTITPDEGYEVSSVTVTDANGNEVAVASDYTFTMPSSNVTVSVIFEEKAPEKPTYTVTIGEAENGTVTADVLEAEAGDTVALTVTPADGYEVSSVTVTDANGNEVTVADDYTFTMPESDVTVNVAFTASSSSDSPATPTHTHTTATVIENYVAATATTDGSYDSVTYCTGCGEIISESHTVIAAYGTGSAEVIDWATVLAGANSSNATNTTTVEDVVIEEPIESTDTETEDDGEEEPAAEPTVEAETPAETNPTTGMVMALIPMAIAALAVVSSKRK